MQYRLILAASMAIAVNASPAPMPTKAPSILKARAPAAAGSSVLSAPMTIAAGETFDGGNVMYDRGVSCTGQEEGGDSDAVFILEKGASLSNVIIGPNQIEGVHCNGGCTITNVWWDAVCEDAFSIKKQDDGETTTINGGGATGAEDKVIQHNGGGTVAINNFEVSDFGKMYRSCGNCKSMPARHVIVTGGSASNGKILVGINSNMGDTASISGVSMTSVGDECIDYEGVTDGSEPSKIGPCSGTGGGSGGSSGTTSAAASTKTSSTKTPAGTKTSSAGSTKTTKSSTKTTKSSTKTKTTKKATKTSTSAAKATKA
ncbi:unnamed protein product [Clonostachys rosea f. rosea IK726]|uniref:Pectate lyase n=2 Tax=Bionectria ochroleuca TaxID=29856 RepID=A0A8H7K4E2_BIOOC|nr:unnamed protein product [Clonostachys rosea f. rosea IK726]